MANKFVAYFSKAGFGKLSVGEYQANLNGLNMFFGAVLGLVLTGTERLTPYQFGVILTLLASVVVSILYISSSRHRLVYAVYTVAMALILPRLVELILGAEGLVPDKVRPTLLVWALMTIAVEFWSREKEKPHSP